MTTKLQGAEVETLHIKDLIPDPENRRLHSPRNIGQIVDSLHEVGAARSVVIDEDGVVLAGNGVIEAAAEAGITKVNIVESDGHAIIAVRRRGLTALQKFQLAMRDNRAGEFATWNAEQLRVDKTNELNLRPYFSESEEAAILLAPSSDEGDDPGEGPRTEHECPRCGYRWRAQKG